MIGNRLKMLREELGLKQEELAKKMSVSPSAIGMYERNLREPNNELTIKFAELFKCSVDYLLGKSDIRNTIIPTSKIPILGTVKAGYDWLVEENVVDYITLKENIPNINEYYALKITGDSMLPLLSDGDLVIVHDQDDV